MVALYEPAARLAREDGAGITGATALREEITALVALQPRITMRVVRVIAGPHSRSRR